MGNKITVEQAAERLGVSKKTIWRLVNGGDLPAVQIGGRQCIRIDVDDLDTVCQPVTPSGETA
jgi:excisionase family DNA binding protein